MHVNTHVCVRNTLYRNTLFGQHVCGTCATFICGEMHMCLKTCVCENTSCFIFRETNMCLETYLWGYTCMRGGTAHIYVETHVCMETTHICMWKRKCAGNTIVDNHMCGARTRNIRMRDTNRFKLWSSSLSCLLRCCVCVHKRNPHKYTSLRNTMLSTGGWASNYDHLRLYRKWNHNVNLWHIQNIVTQHGFECAKQNKHEMCDPHIESKSNRTYKYESEIYFIIYESMLAMKA